MNNIDLIVNRLLMNYHDMIIPATPGYKARHP